jgi:hypothetical protein
MITNRFEESLRLLLFRRRSLRQQRNLIANLAARSDAVVNPDGRAP